MQPELDILSAERLWKLFFAHFDRAHGIALVQELWRIEQRRHEDHHPAICPWKH